MSMPANPPHLPPRGAMLRLGGALALVLGLAACGGALGGQPTMAAAASPGSYAARFDSAWQTVDAEYSYFAYKHIDWNATRTQFRTRAEQAASEEEFTTVMHEMLATLQDQHVVLRNTLTGVTLATYSPNHFVNWDKDVWQQYVTRGGWVQGQSNWGYATFGQAGYIAIGAWNPDQVRIGDLDAALERFREAPALILDVRMNSGGDDQLAFQFAGRFTATARVTGAVQFRNGPLHVDFTPQQARTVAPRGRWQFTRPVLLLVGRACASSNESFIAAMRELPNVIVVGDTTAGATGNPAFFDLGGGWQYSVSRWIEYTAQGTVIEGNGIAPAVFVPATPSDFQQGRDPVLEWAMAHT